MIHLHFVTETGKRGNRGREARIHTARICRQRKWQAKARDDVFRCSRYNQLVRENVDVQIDEDGLDATALLTATKEADSGVDDLESVCPSERGSTCDGSISDFSSARSSISRSVSPVFGSLTDSFGERYSTPAAQLIQYWLEVVMRTTLQSLERPAWVQEFCHQPIVFHCLAYVACVYQEKCHHIQVSEQVILGHKVKLISLINEALTGVQNGDDNASLQPLILGISTLWKVPRSSTIVYNFGLFQPKIPDAHIIHASNTGNFNNPHAKSLLLLIDRIGGLEHINRFPKLGPTLTVADCLAAAAHLARPALRSYWRTQGFLDSVRPLFRISSSRKPSGFDVAVPGSLPCAAKSVYNWLRDIDFFIEVQQAMDEPHSFLVCNARTAILHDLLSLPSWGDLKLAGETTGCYQAVYELCKTTAMVYSCCVLFPLNKRTRWLPKLLDQLLDIVEWSNLPIWNIDGVIPLSVWCHFVGAMAAHEEDPVMWRSFLGRLREILVANDLTQWPQVEAILLLFLWTNSTCGPGAVVVWDALDLHHL